MSLALLFNQSSGITVALGQAIETDLAQAISWSPKARLVAQVAEADSAQAISARKLRAIAQALEADNAQAISVAKRLAIGQSTEADAAQALARSKAKSIAQTSEADLAQSVARLKAKLIAQATEADLAQPITRQSAQIVAVGQATEIDVAQAISYYGAPAQQPATANEGAWVKLTGEYPEPRRRRSLDPLPTPAQTFPRVEPAPSIHLREVHADLRVLDPDPEVELAFREGLAGELVSPVGPRGTSPARADEELAIALLLAA